MGESEGVADWKTPPGMRDEAEGNWKGFYGSGGNFTSFDPWRANLLASVWGGGQRGGADPIWRLGRRKSSLNGRIGGSFPHSVS